MSTISTHLRNFKEPTREQLNLLFFSLPVDAETHGGEKAASGELEKMEISAVLTLGVQNIEDAYVSGFGRWWCSYAGTSEGDSRFV